MHPRRMQPSAEETTMTTAEAATIANTHIDDVTHQSLIALRNRLDNNED